MKFALPVLLGLSVGTLAAQVPADSVSPPADSVIRHKAAIDLEVPILDHTFNGEGEFVRFRMSGGIVYRAVVDREDVQLIVEPVEPEGPSVTVTELQRFHDASGERRYLLRPVADAEYQFRAPFVGSATDTTTRGLPNSAQGGASHLRLYRDERETARWNATGPEAWAFGLVVSGGRGGKYPIAGIPAPSGSSSDIEGCLEVKYGPGFGGYISGCVLGISHESRPASKSATWVFIEPRLRLIGSGKRWQQRLDAGVLLRAGLGQIDGLNQQPGVIAPGVYLSYLLSHHPHWPRLVLEGAVRYSYVVPSDQPGQTSAQGTVGVGIF
ncbi:MAG: hypothetical protein ABJC74_08520 [Gemmatimonadota bacterium]